MADIASGLIGIALGAAVLLFGKDLRVFGAAAGFLIGFTVTQQVAPDALSTALIAAVILAIIALILVAVAGGAARLLIQLIGAVAGAAVSLWLGQLFGFATGVASWIVIFIGALIGFGLMARFFNTGVIILASLLGASLIVNGLGTFIALPSEINFLITLGLIAIGFFYQRRR